MASPSVQASSPILDTSRPSLPPLRSLCLPGIRARRTSFHVSDVDSRSSITNDLLPAAPLDFNHSWPSGRQSPVSSMAASCIPSSHATSRVSTSTEVCAPRHQPMTRAVRQHHPYKYRVVLSDSYDDADAMLVLPLPMEAVDENNRPIPEKLKQYSIGKAYLIVGPLAYELRDSQNRARLRAAVHPYHLIPRNPQRAVKSRSHSNATPTGSAFPHYCDSTTSNCLNTA